MTESGPEFGEDLCRRFIAATAGRATPEQLLRALDLAAHGSAALELGCGAGDDTAAMLERGFAVTVVDEQAAALDATRTRTAGVGAGPDLVRARSDAFSFEPDRFDLVHARYSIPFCPADAFPRVWAGIRRTLRPGGVFAGQLFGPNDTFVTERGPDRITAHTRSDAVALLDGLEVIELKEEEEDGTTSTGRAKHWHVHHILARRPGPGGQG
jgi:SAM-dependent methyltransferase